MYIRRRTMLVWSNLAKSHKGKGWDEAHLPAGLRISRLKVPVLLRCEILASKQMRFAITITSNDDRH